MATKIPVQAVIEINGKQVENSFQKISAEARSLERDLKKLALGSDEYNKKSAELTEVNKYLTEHKSRLNDAKKAAQDFNDEINNGSDIVSRFKDRFISNLQAIASGEMTFKSLGAVIKFFAAESWAAISSIPIIGWVAAATAALGLAVRQIYQYNNELLEANKLTASVTKLQGDELDKMTVRSQTLQQLFNFDPKDTLTAARNLVQNFGITYSEAMDRIEDGVARGGSANGEFLDSIREYPVFFAKAGYSAQEFINIINAGFDLGIYSDKLPDTLKEFDLSMREQTKTTRDALVNSFGAAFSDDLLKRVSQGKTTVKNALIEITAESQKYNLTQKQQAQLTADVFRGAGEDVGGFAKIVDVVTLAIIEQGGALTEHQQAVKDQIDGYNELGEAKLDALKSDAFYAFKRDIENIWIGIQKLWFQFIAHLRNNINLIRVGFMTIADGGRAIPQVFTMVFNVVKANLAEMAMAIMAAGRMMKQAFTLDFDGAAQSFEKMKGHMANALNNSKKAVADLAGSAGRAFATNYKEVIDSDAAKASAQRILENQRNAAGKENNFDGSAGGGGKTKAGPKAKTPKEIKDEQEAIEKAEREAYRNRMNALFQFQADKAKVIDDAFQRETSQEVVRRNKEQFENNQKILDLEKAKLTASVTVRADMEKEIQTLRDIEKLNEDTHWKTMLAIQKKYDNQAIEAHLQAEQFKINENRRIAEDSINEITTMEEARLALSEMAHLKLTDQELNGIKNLEDAKRALREDADLKMIDAQMVSLEASKKIMLAALEGMTGPAADQLRANLAALTEEMTRLQAAKNGNIEGYQKKVQEEGDAAKGSVDILGFSAKQWEDTWDNINTTEGKIQAVQMAVQALGNAFRAFGELQRTLAERDMQKFQANQDKKKSTLLKSLNEGYITNEEYNRQVQKMEAETANKKAAIAYKQAKTERLLKVAEIITATSLAIMQAYAQLGPIGGTIAAVLIGTLGAFQLGTVMNTPLPEKPSYARGGFTGSGFGLPDETGFKPAGIVHEREWVAPEWMVADRRYANIIGYLESVRTGGAAPMAQGGLASSDTGSSSASSSSESVFNTAGLSDPEIKTLYRQIVSFLDYLISNGVHIEDSMQNARRLEKMQKSWNELTNKNKH